MDSGLVYCLYWNQAAGAYLLLHFLIFLSLQFQSIKIFVILFLGTVRPTKVKLDVHMGNGLIYCVYQNQAASAYLSLYFLIFLLPIN